MIYTVPLRVVEVYYFLFCLLQVLNMKVLFLCVYHIMYLIVLPLAYMQKYIFIIITTKSVVFTLNGSWCCLCLQDTYTHNHQNTPPIKSLRRIQCNDNLYYRKLYEVIFLYLIFESSRDDLMFVQLKNQAYISEVINIAVVVDNNRKDSQN